MFNYEQWDGFEGRLWKEEINTRDFIQKNYTPYDGDASFLAGPTEATDKLWGILQGLQKEERAKGGVLDMDTDIVSSLTSHKPGYISESLKEKEQIVGLQTDAPLKRIVNLYGGLRTAKSALEQYGYELNPEIEKHFKLYRKTHNDGVFDAYREKEVKVWGLEDIKDTVNEGNIGLKGSPTRVKKSFTKQAKGAGTILNDLSDDEAVAAIVEKLQEKHII